MYLANVAFGLGYAQVGAGFGRDRTTVRHACAKIEDARDCAGFDAGLCVLEAALCQHADFCAQLAIDGPDDSSKYSTELA